MPSCREFYGKHFSRMCRDLRTAHKRATTFGIFCLMQFIYQKSYFFKTGLPRIFGVFVFVARGLVCCLFFVARGLIS